MIKVTHRGSFKKTDKFLAAMKARKQFAALEKFGSVGVAALERATPKDSTITSKSWYYVITTKPGYYAIAWHNGHREGGPPVAIMLQYGHGTRNGGYVQGRDYINPAMRPIFDQIATEMWKVVTQS